MVFIFEWSPLQMTLVSVTFFGFTVADVVFIVGFVMEKQEGNTQFWMFLYISYLAPNKAYSA